MNATVLLIKYTKTRLNLFLYDYKILLYFVFVTSACQTDETLIEEIDCNGKTIYYQFFILQYDFSITITTGIHSMQ
jgi:hypothetical protein